MAADLIDVGEGKAERKAAAAVLRMTALAESHEVRKVVRLTPAWEIPEGHDVVYLKAVLTRVFAATLAALTIAFTCLARLFSPVRAIIRLIAALPQMVPFWVIAQPFIPAGCRTEAAHISPDSGSSRQRSALFAGERQGRQSFGARPPFLRCADARSRRSVSLEPCHLLRSIFRRIAFSRAEKASSIIGGCLRREEIERFAARLALTSCSTPIGAPPTFARTINIRIALQVPRGAVDFLAARAASDFHDSSIAQSSR